MFKLTEVGLFGLSNMSIIQNEDSNLDFVENINFDMPRSVFSIIVCSQRTTFDLFI